MDEFQLNRKLRKEKNYLGSFALDELNEIKIDIFPSFLIINLDNRENTGTHWIALAVFENVVYICDSLGGLLPDESIPTPLVNFLHVLLISRKLYITTQLQPIDPIHVVVIALYLFYSCNRKNPLNTSYNCSQIT